MAAIQDVFRECGQLIIDRAGQPGAIRTKDRDGSSVTRTDEEVEERLLSVLRERFPDLPVFGEESGYDEDNLPLACWLIDPLDGTNNFIEGSTGFTCMGVLIQNGQAVASIIYDPSSKAMYTAKKGQGAYKNGQKLDLAAMPLPEVALCKDLFIDELDKILAPKGVHCVNPRTGGGYGFTMVADGRAAARFNMHGGGYVHDYAPGGLLVREAGGVLVPILDAQYGYQTRSFVACHPDVAAVIEQYVPRLRELEVAK